MDLPRSARRITCPPVQIQDDTDLKGRGAAHCHNFLQPRWRGGRRPVGKEESPRHEKNGKRKGVQREEKVADGRHERREKATLVVEDTARVGEKARREILLRRLLHPQRRERDKRPRSDAKGL